MISPFLPVTAFSPAIQAAFVKAGWYPGRQAKEWDMPDYPPAIRALVLEWGGLIVRAGGFVRFEPLAEIHQQFEEQAGSKLYSIGETQDYWNICVNNDGIIRITFDWMERVGDNFEEGMTLLLTGRN